MQTNAEFAKSLFVGILMLVVVVRLHFKEFKDPDKVLWANFTRVLAIITMVQVIFFN